jgi:DNA-binding transcriptional LysR family regulator
MPFRAQAGRGDRPWPPWELVPSSVGAPAYFASHPVPGHPRELIDHACLNYRAGPDAPPVRWPFTEDGHDFSVAVKDRVLTNDDALLLRLARDGIGLTLGREEAVRPYIERGELVPRPGGVLRAVRRLLPLLPGAAAGLAGPPRAHRLPAPAEAGTVSPRRGDGGHEAADDDRQRPRHGAATYQES